LCPLGRGRYGSLRLPHRGPLFFIERTQCRIGTAACQKTGKQ